MATKINIISGNKYSDVSLNRTGIELNELSMKAQGGTELMQGWLYERLPEELKDVFQIICSRVRVLDEKRPKLLWLHDLAGDPEVQFLKDSNNREMFKKLIYVSNWQCQQYANRLGVPYSDGVILRNAIDPIPEHKKPTDRIKLIYHTTPHRGLSILIPVFEKLAEIHPEIELDVYSSFKIYGWEERDNQFLELFDRCRSHPRINYYGSVSNSEIRKALTQAHIFAYPSIWEETSCISAIEAMSAGCITVCPNLGALPETCSSFAFMYQFHEDANQHANIFINALNSAINSLKKNKENMQVQLNFQKQYFDVFYGWETRIEEWKSLMNSILGK
jgi:glycosyltransferase involved in cell wall biosynthesis